jgi:rhodanese-related sulfurtransferase
MRFLATFFLVAALLLPIPRAAGESTTDYISVDEARKLQLAGSPIVFIDVRSEQEWREARIKGAHSIPVDVIGRRASEVPRSGLVVLY